ncbi:MAG: hypothetical protein IPL87_05005 [Candidatus Moraniibacteriota bacterium]|nr:MAG: hypothetical protein IPL87_05005 [Candidatus Moranbacteria bacterium]
MDATNNASFPGKTSEEIAPTVLSRKSEHFCLLFHIELNSTKVILKKKKGERDRILIENSREVLERLLLSADEMLRRHDLSRRDIADVRVESNVPEGYSSRNIAETAARTWNAFAPL